jgi:hypothetical protein
MLRYVADCSSVEAEVEDSDMEQEELDEESPEDEDALCEDEESEASTREGDEGASAVEVAEEPGQKYTPITHYRCAICKDSTKDALR